MGKRRLFGHEPVTDPELTRKLKEAVKHKMTPEEILAQKRSWVVGNMGIKYPDRPIEEIEASVDESLRQQGYKI